MREREDQQYEQIMRVHQGTVDTYLDWIFRNTIEQGTGWCDGSVYKAGDDYDKLAEAEDERASGEVREEV